MVFEHEQQTALKVTQFIANFTKGSFVTASDICPEGNLKKAYTDTPQQLLLSATFFSYLCNDGGSI